ncbi:MAG: hypothetical protein ACRD8O_23070 [Bryobacteraceae bacterium]
MADSQHAELSAVVTQAKRDSYLRHVQIHMELLRDSLTGREFGCGVGQAECEAIEKHLLDIWNIAWAAQIAVVDRPPAPSAPSADGGWRMANGEWRMANGEWRKALRRWQGHSVPAAPRRLTASDGGRRKELTA